MTFQAELAVVSDIHLLRADDDRGQRLIEVIDYFTANELTHFVMLGDIFDICLGNHPYFQKKFAPIGAALSRLAQSSTKVHYLEGNHEFRIEALPWDGVNFVTAGALVLDIGGERFQFEHGDLIYSHSRYKKFRKFIKSRLVTESLKYFPGATLDRLATSSAKVSRAQDEHREINHDAILSHAWQWLAAGNASKGFFGHFHVPYAETHNSKPQQKLFSVDSWDHPNVLVLKDGEFYRWDLARHSSIQLEPASSILSK